MSEVIKKCLVCEGTQFHPEMKTKKLKLVRDICISCRTILKSYIQNVKEQMPKKPFGEKEVIEFNWG